MPECVPENLLCISVSSLFLESILVMRRENAELLFSSGSCNVRYCCLFHEGNGSLGPLVPRYGM